MRPPVATCLATRPATRPAICAATRAATRCSREARPLAQDYSLGPEGEPPLKTGRGGTLLGTLVALAQRRLAHCHPGAPQILSFLGSQRFGSVHVQRTAP